MVNSTSRLVEAGTPQRVLRGWRAEERWRKQMPSCNRMDRSCGFNFAAQAGRLPAWSIVTRELVEPSQKEKQMNVDSSMCASLGEATHWDQMNWPKCERQVRRLQARIVKATRKSRWGKVQALQRLLTCSFSGKALAVKRVTENQGKRTSGVDSISWKTSAAKLTAIGSLQRRGYRLLPLRRIYIPKANGKQRPSGGLSRF